MLEIIPYFSIYSSLIIFLIYKKFPIFIYKSAIFHSFVFISLQNFFIYQIDNLRLDKDYFFLITQLESFILDIALATIIWLGFIFSHFNKHSIDYKIVFFLIGAMQVAILITAASLDFFSIQMKIMCNTLYILLPAFVLYEIQNKDDNVQQKREQQ